MSTSTRCAGWFTRSGNTGDGRGAAADTFLDVNGNRLLGELCDRYNTQPALEPRLAPGRVGRADLASRPPARLRRPSDDGYPAVICFRLVPLPPTRPVRRLGAGMATGAVRAAVGVALVSRRASAGHMCTACCASFSSQAGTGMLRMTG